jgi:hypothetical protein
MRISIKNMVKIYSISNLIADQIVEKINEENINIVISDPNQLNNYIYYIFAGIQLIYNIYNLDKNKQKRIISIYYNNYDISYINFAIFLFIFIFFRDIKNVV